MIVVGTSVRNKIGFFGGRLIFSDWKEVVALLIAKDTEKLLLLVMVVVEYVVDSEIRNTIGAM